MSVTSKYFRFCFFSLFERQNMKHCVHNWWKKVCGIKYRVCKKKHTILLEFSFCNATFPSTLQLFLIFLGTRVEVFKVDRIHNAVWFRTPYSLVHGYECFGGAFWAYLHRLSEDRGSMSWLKPQYQHARLHGPVTRRTVILTLNILHSPCILWLPYLSQTN
jgi:hypothetical protein